ncbi:rhomboid family intramembrane serine protease [Sungkyunkwania multivorans]|uniref:Rhomboid family intramembrane serine protease n=1 Tax=Sungkyunkwania multivorans TaxID=1173618 RepID=A0ABW3CU89_9FLAO
MGWSDDIKYRLNRLDVVGKLIVANIVMFIVPIILRSVFGLFKIPFVNIVEWLELYPSFERLLFRPWTLITYGFLHADIWHIFWNMFILWFAAKMILNLFNGKRFLNIYFLGIIAGGLAFMISYNIFPFFENKFGPIVGASAGVMAALIFICTYLPDKEVRLIFFNVKLWYIAAFFVIKDLMLLSSDNGGGSFAHLGGALLGFMYARQLANGKDIGAGFGKMMDAISNMFKPRTKSPLKTVHRKTKTNVPFKKSTTVKSAQQQKIDAILDKISKSGYESLTKAEKDFLFKAGKED